MSWNSRGGKSSTLQDAQESNLEAQNDTHLNDLHSKLQTLRGVTSDIYNDSLGQNRLLDGTGNVFDQFKASLSSTSNRFSRTVANGSSGNRLMLYIIGGIVGLFVLYKLFGSSSTKQGL